MLGARASNPRKRARRSNNDDDDASSVSARAPSVQSTDDDEWPEFKPRLCQNESCKKPLINRFPASAYNPKSHRSRRDLYKCEECLQKEGRMYCSGSGCNRYRPVEDFYNIRRKTNRKQDHVTCDYCYLKSNPHGKVLVKIKELLQLSFEWSPQFVQLCQDGLTPPEYQVTMPVLHLMEKFVSMHEQFMREEQSRQNEDSSTSITTCIFNTGDPAVDAVLKAVPNQDEDNTVHGEVCARVPDDVLQRLLSSAHEQHGSTAAGDDANCTAGPATGAGGADHQLSSLQSSLIQAQDGQYREARANHGAQHPKEPGAQNAIGTPQSFVNVLMASANSGVPAGLGDIGNEGSSSLLARHPLRRPDGVVASGGPSQFVKRSAIISPYEQQRAEHAAELAAAMHSGNRTAYRSSVGGHSSLFAEKNMIGTPQNVQSGTPLTMGQDGSMRMSIEASSPFLAQFFSADGPGSLQKSAMDGADSSLLNQSLQLQHQSLLNSVNSLGGSHMRESHLSTSADRSAHDDLTHLSGSRGHVAGSLPRGASGSRNADGGNFPYASTSNTSGGMLRSIQQRNNNVLIPGSHGLDPSSLVDHSGRAVGMLSSSTGSKSGYSGSRSSHVDDAIPGSMESGGMLYSSVGNNMFLDSVQGEGASSMSGGAHHMRTSSDLDDHGGRTKALLHEFGEQRPDLGMTRGRGRGIGMEPHSYGSSGGRSEANRGGSSQSRGGRDDIFDM